MFTGIIRQRGTITDIKQKGNNRAIEIKNAIFTQMSVGDSVAVDGVCLTITKKNKNHAWFDVIAETLKKTTLKNYTKKMIVHLEKPLKLGAYIHGHILLGHVDCMAKIAYINEKKLTLSMPPQLHKKIALKGSIGINGVSLTIAQKGNQNCTVAFTPETLRKTTFTEKRPGDFVNVEIDLLKRYESQFTLQKGTKIAIVASQFNQSIVEKLVYGARKGLTEKGFKNIPILWVPGAFEIPLTLKKLALQKKYDALIALGVVIKGETDHYEHVCRETTHGIAQVALETNTPIIFEVLMCDTVQKAIARAKDDMKYNKGYHAAAAALHMITTFKKL